MAAVKIVPTLHGVYMSREKWMIQVVGPFEKFDDGRWTVDELVLHPRDAIRFCLVVNEKLAETKKIPDDFILRTIMTYRKNISRMKKKSTSQK